MLVTQAIARVQPNRTVSKPSVTAQVPHPQHGHRARTTPTTPTRPYLSSQVPHSYPTEKERKLPPSPRTGILPQNAETPRISRKKRPTFRHPLPTRTLYPARVKRTPLPPSPPAPTSNTCAKPQTCTPPPHFQPSYRMPRDVVVASGHLVSPPMCRKPVRILHLPTASARHSAPHPLQRRSRLAAAAATTTTTAAAATDTTLPSTTSTFTRSARSRGLRPQYLSREKSRSRAKVSQQARWGRRGRRLEEVVG